uniref:Uncharacterized protein n=1 Tax=Oryza meridionalis TaxID=40149 RepID=A0A0E0CWC0_9ORYZ
MASRGQADPTTRGSFTRNRRRPRTTLFLDMRWMRLATGVECVRNTAAAAVARRGRRHDDELFLPLCAVSLPPPPPVLHLLRPSGYLPSTASPASTIVLRRLAIGERPGDKRRTTIATRSTTYTASARASLRLVAAITALRASAERDV